jgi:hypothetical protein
LYLSKIFSGNSHYWQNGISKGLGTCTELEELTLLRYPAKDLGELQGMCQLRKLKLSQPKAQSLLGAGGMSGLEVLEIYGAASLAELSGLASLPKVSSVTLMNCNKVGDMSVLASLPALERVELYNVGPISGLAKLPHLQELRVTGKSKVSQADVDALQGVPGVFLAPPVLPSFDGRAIDWKSLIPKFGPEDWDG